MTLQNRMIQFAQERRNKERLAAWIEKRENAARRNFTPRIFTNANSRVNGNKYIGCAL